jgi:uncharacterized protein YbbC (DUF1343 family)
MKFSLLIFLYAFPLAFSSPGQSRVKTGDEVFVENHLEMIKGKKVGIITNQSGILQAADSAHRNGRNIIDVLSNLPGTKVVAIFAPEHGIRGVQSAGEYTNDSVDERTGIRIYSLYGKTTKPSPAMLKGINVLIYDIQDVGARFYTFVSTLDLTLEAAAENHIKYIVLDRPDMLRADLIDGPILVDSLRSFVGIQPIPGVYGMTPGELATMINDEHMLKDGVKADLTVIKMKNYERRMWYDETGLKWIKPSPNLPDMNSIELYPGSVLIEGTNISEGRGSEHPFESVGAPFIDSQRLVRLLARQHISGAKFDPVEFTPHSFPWASKPKFDGELCHGVKITVVDRNIFKPVEMGVILVWAIYKLYPHEFRFDAANFDRLCGTRDIRLALTSGKSPKMIFTKWNTGMVEFEKLHAKYLLYK